MRIPSWLPNILGLWDQFQRYQTSCRQNRSNLWIPSSIDFNRDAQIPRYDKLLPSYDTSLRRYCALSQNWYVSILNLKSFRGQMNMTPPSPKWSRPLSIVQRCFSLQQLRLIIRLYLTARAMLLEQHCTNLLITNQCQSPFSPRNSHRLRKHTLLMTENY